MDKHELLGDLGLQEPMRFDVYYVYPDEEKLSDYVIEVWEGEDLLFKGDDYHSDIEAKVEGFFLGLQYAGATFNRITEHVTDRARWETGV